MGVAVITIHGMGDYIKEDGSEKDYDKKLRANINKQLHENTSVPILSEPEDLLFW